ncbi:MAG: tetratricopeptide repeat protein [Actinomycetes bacterium]
MSGASSQDPSTRGTAARAARLAASKPPKSGGARGKPPGAPPAASSEAHGVDLQASALDERVLNADELAALEEQRTFLLRSLRDLDAEHDAMDIDDVDYEALKDDYTARAAAVIRAIATHHALSASRLGRWSLARRVIVGAVVIAVAIGAGIFVAHSAGQRTAGDTVSGGTRQSTRDQLMTARQLQQTRNYPDAIKAYDEVLKIDPTNVEALSFRGWMLRLVALQTDGANRQLLDAKALESLHQALQIEPTDGTALVFLAVLQGDLGLPKEALGTLASVPAGQIPDFMASTVETFRQKTEAQVAAAGS